jgi:hypothetical protein
MALNAGAATANLAGKGIEAVTEKDLPEVPYIKKPFLGSDSISDMASSLSEFLGYDVLEPEEMTSLQRKGYTVDRFATGAGGAAGLLAKGAKAGSMIDEVAPALAHPYKEAPGRTAAGDVGAGAGSGLAIDLAHEYLPESWQGPLLTLMAALGGGHVGHAVTDAPGTLDRVRRSVTDRLPASRELYDPKTGRTPNIGAADDAARFVQKSATEKKAALEDIEAGHQYFEDAGGVVPTTGTLTADPRLQVMERGLRDMNPKPFIERDAAVRKSAQADVGAIRPEGADAARPRQIAEGYADE